MIWEEEGKSQAANPAVSTWLNNGLKTAEKEKAAPKSGPFPIIDF
jgi:hypothetical protein